MGFRGIDIRQTGDRLIFRASLKNSGGAIVATGATSLYLFGYIAASSWFSTTATL